MMGYIIGVVVLGVIIGAILEVIGAPRQLVAVGLLGTWGAGAGWVVWRFMQGGR